MTSNELCIQQRMIEVSDEIRLMIQTFHDQLKHRYLIEESNNDETQLSD